MPACATESLTHRRDSPRCQSPVESIPEEEHLSLLARLIGWYPCFLLRITQEIAFALLPMAWQQIALVIPVWIFNFWMWIFWQFMQLPLTIFKMFMTVLITPMSERNRKKRTVLISGGSTIQSLHLARNFYSAGARVVVCEVEGLFALARFSTAVNKFYTIPKPNSEYQQNYVRTLCEIVEKEKVSYYVPVSSTTSAYYDAAAKPHLELLGCTSFCPGIKEVWALDDTLEIFKSCEKMGILTPVYHEITSKNDVLRLYESGEIRTGRYVMTTAGPSGLIDRVKFVLPPSRADLKLPHDISQHRPWVVVQDVEGDHFLTCTTVKESKVIANVTCLLDRESKGLVPVENNEINEWLHNFFHKLTLLRPVTGHISFRFVRTKNNNVLPLSSRLGVSLPYICYTSVHPRLLWKPCKHFSKQSSGPLIAESGRYWMPETVVNTLKHPSIENVTRLIGTVLDKREVLFTLWDPLPYCAYYHMQLPFKNILGFVQKQQNKFPQPVAAPVH
ncbi:hypothetical protein RN001_005484 [Aquatica leii]|uniref:Uncharacterized protein n=1 Tax=Aquatica leii TaxID=1421715 RepID=A0AAN7SS27_9COLE|nr:hypothetical protein RN001_005484 [Aquatica leii]